VSSQVDICNLALSHLGDSATVSSIDPPEGSAQAEHCARFYPIALASLLELHPWSFATTRAALAPVTNPASSYAYAYALPSDAVNLLAILAADATDDFSSPAQALANVYDNPYARTIIGGGYTPVDYSTELNANGQEILLTNQPGAMLRYTRLVTDTAKFTPLFVTTLSWRLAADLAGPVLKGQTGAAAAKVCMTTMDYWLARAKDSDASQRQAHPRQQVGWINAR
jgi:hypothetical protein